MEDKLLNVKWKGERGKEQNNERGEISVAHIGGGMMADWVNVG